VSGFPSILSSPFYSFMFSSSSLSLCVSLFYLCSCIFSLLFVLSVLLVFLLHVFVFLLCSVCFILCILFWSVLGGFSFLSSSLSLSVFFLCHGLSLAFIKPENAMHSCLCNGRHSLICYHFFFLVNRCE